MMKHSTCTASIRRASSCRAGCADRSGDPVTTAGSTIRQVTAPVVRRIFALNVQERLGTTAIAKQLRSEDAPGPTAGWGHPAVLRILTNPTYLGRVRWRDQVFDAAHEPSIDPATFDGAQAILAKRGDDVPRRRGNPSDFLLSGLVRCANTAARRTSG
jgi:site-specific DNA recombinase